MGEIYDISLEDYSELTFLEPQEMRSAKKTNSAIKQKLLSKRIREEYKQFQGLFESDDDGNRILDGFNLGTMDDGSLNILAGATDEKRRQERYSHGLDLALPTPSKEKLRELEKLYSERGVNKKLFQDASTSPRGVGRPKNVEYKTAKVSVGEITSADEV